MKPQRRREGFTVIEILVVVGIIAVLVGILLPALSGAQKRSRKNTELNYLRQIGFAWSMYANNYDDAALPGYLEPEVQTLWNVDWETPFHTVLPPDDAGPYPWRLMPFLDFNLEVLMYYDDSYELDLTVPEDVTKIARHPAFGYNAYYIGGWYKQVNVSGVSVAKPVFHDALVVGGAGKPASPVSTRVTQIRRPTEVLTFCSTTPMSAGLMKSRDILPGSFMAHAPTVGVDEHWTSFTAGGGGGALTQGQTAGSVYEVQSFNRSGVPLGRFTKLVAVLYADGHTDTQTPGAMTDMRMWISNADDRNFAHDVGTIPINTFGF